MTTTPAPHTAPPTFGQAPVQPQDFAHPDATDRIVAQPKPSFGQSMGARSTEFKNALIAGGVGIAVAFLAAGFGLGYWAGDAGSTGTTPQSGFSQMGGNSPMGGGQMGSGQMGGGQMGSGQTGSGQTGSGQTGSGTQNGFPGGSFGGQSQDGTGTGTAPGTGTGSTTS